eukprot:g13266.t1
MLENTLGVLTKCDDAASKKIRRALEDQADPINTSKHKYVVTSNEPGESSLEAQAAAERKFFMDEGMSDLVDAGQATCDALVKKVSDMYNAYLLETWVPTTFQLLVLKKKELRESIADLGVPLQGSDSLGDAVVKGATRLAKAVVDRQLDMVVDQVLESFEESATKAIAVHVGVDLDLQTLQRTMNATYKGTLHDDVVRAAQGAADSMGGLLVQGLKEALRKDVAGNADGTPARVGRFDAFVEAVVSLASEAIAGKIDSLKRDVKDCVNSTLRKVACPSYNLKARQGRIEMDPKVLVDAVMHIVLDVALAPLVDESVVENAAKACTNWEESCAETRSSLEKEIQSVEKVMCMEIFTAQKKKLDAKYENEFPNGTLLVCACEKGRLEDVHVLVECHDMERTGMSVDEMVSREGKNSNGNSFTPLQAAAYYEQFEIVQYLVKSCTTVDLIGQTDNYGNSSLHFAAWYSTKDVQMLQCLIDNYNGDIKDIINQKHNDGGTPLDFAYGYNNSSIKKAIVSLLRKYGGKANFYDKNGNRKALGDALKLVQNYKNEFSRGNSLVCACERGRLEDVRMLVEGHDVEKTGMSVDEMVSRKGKDSRGNSTTPLQSAAENEQLEIAQYLVKTCTTVDLIGYKKSDGYNSLHYAARYSKKNVQTLQFLIDNYNGDIKNIINQKTDSGNTPLDHAYDYNKSPIKKDIVSLLRKYGGKANWWDKNGNYVGKGKGDLND